MFHHGSFVTTTRLGRDALEQHASALVGERPRTVCRSRRARRALRRGLARAVRREPARAG